MKLIEKLSEKLSDMIEEELDGAMQYAKCALAHKEDYPALADTFYRIANQEMEHVEMLHAQVKDQIESWREVHGDLPEGMQTLYDYLHKKHIETAREIKIALAMYKE